jgi:hypothetical protein
VRISNKLWKGSVEHEFSARAFTKDACDPRRKPDFAAAQDDAGAEPAGDDSAGDEGDKPKPKKGRAKKKPKPVEEDEGGGASDDN